jgi:hypothetical protein
LLERKSPEYLHNASICRKMARTARVDDRATFLDLAQHWEGMAEIEARIIATLEALERQPLMWSAGPRHAA